MRRMLGLVLVVGALAASGIVSAATQASTHGHGGPNCYGSCPSRTTLSASLSSVVFGSEQLEVFTVTVTPRIPGTSGTPTGTVLVDFHGAVLCSVTLVAGTGMCSPSSNALLGTHRSYPIKADYQGDSNFAPSRSHAVPIKVTGGQSGHGGKNGDDDSQGNEGGQNDQGEDGSGH